MTPFAHGNGTSTLGRVRELGSAALALLALHGCGLIGKENSRSSRSTGGTAAVSGLPAAGRDGGVTLGGGGVSSGGGGLASGGADASSSGNAGSGGSASTSSGGSTSNAFPETLYQRTAGSLRAIEVDESRVYWNESAVLYAAPKDGSGPVTELGSAAGVKDVTHDLITTDATHVYWQEDAHINVVDKASGELTRLDLEEGHTYCGIRADDTHVYAVEIYCRSTARVPKAGGSVEVTPIPGEHPEGGVTGIALDDQNLYCARGPSIYKHPKGGGDVVTIHSDTDEMVSIGPLAADGASVYFGSNDRAVGGGRNQDLKTIPSSGGEPTLLFHYGSPIGRILLDQTRSAVYCQSILNGVRSITEVSLSAGTTRNLVEHEDVPYGIAHDDGYVYWVSGDGRIRRVRK